MEILEHGDDLLVTCCHPGDPDMKSLIPMFLGKSTYRNSPRVRVENNVVNRIVLGLDPLGYQKEKVLIKDFSWMKGIAEDDDLDKFQVEDIRKGAWLVNHLNFNPMGLGKTVETVRVMKAWGITDAVILAPKAVCPQWISHIAEWYPEASELAGLHDFSKDIIVTNYEKLLQPARLDILRNHRREAVIFDEVHYLKNKDSKRTIFAEQIPAKYHVGLTGTPILKHPDDLWSVLHSVDWHYSGKSYWNFVNYFCNVVNGYFGREIQGITKNASRLAILHKLLELVSIRNDEVQVAFGKRCVDVYLPMEKMQATLYKKIKKLALDELPDNCTIANGAVLALRLQQTTSWPGLFDVSDAGAKFSWIETFCKNTDERVVVFTKFAKTANALRAHLATKKVSSVLYTGEQNDQQRQVAKNKFINGDTQVFIGTIAAVGTGTDGLQVARLGIMVEKDWSPEINKQCEDRLHRRGQKMPVMWYYLNCEKSFDQHVGRVNLSKADAIRAALEGEE